MEDNNTQLYRSPVTGGNGSQNIIKIILSIVVGAIIGAGISIPLALSIGIGKGISQETKTKITHVFKKDLKYFFSDPFYDTNTFIFSKKGSRINIAGITATLLGYETIIQAGYSLKQGEWKLKGTPKVYLVIPPNDTEEEED